MQHKLHSLKSAGEVGQIDLSDKIFGLKPRVDIIARVIDWQLAKRRAGTHKTKDIADIQGTTKKPYKQKGTGRARQGSLRSPQFRGGARIHGPVVRSHEYDLPKKIRKLGLCAALSAKYSEGQLIIVDRLETDGKTKALAQNFAKMGWDSVLLIDGGQVNDNFRRAVMNLKHVDILPQIGANVYDIIRHKTLVLSREAVEMLEARLK